jgi:hypothetical protein
MARFYFLSSKFSIFSLAIIVFIGGLIVNTTLHSYLSACFAYIIAFYYRLSIVLGK